MVEAVHPKKKFAKPEWLAKLAPYQKPELKKSLWQLANTLTPYFLLLALMVYTVQRGYSYWLTLALAVPAGGLLVRIFIFFHDCGHGAFFSKHWANTLVGYITGILTFTPYEDWRHEHGVHHATAGNLDRRGVGDVWTMTVEEYLAAPPAQRLGYALFRNPLIMFGLGPLYVFLLRQRLPHAHATAAARRSVAITNLALLATLAVASLTIGLRTYVLVQLPVILIGGGLGVWLFYVQHQFEGVYWARQETWNPVRASLEGSSYYKLPGVLRWFSGNIGLHHIHHLRPRIPNYNLQRCYDAVPEVRAVNPVTFRASLKCLRLNVWDEAHQRLISFRELRALRAGA